MTAAAWLVLAPLAMRPQGGDDLTPEQAMRMLNEVRGLQGRAAELLAEAAKAPAEERQKEAVELLNRILRTAKEDAAASPRDRREPQRRPAAAGSAPRESGRPEPAARPSDGSKVFRFRGDRTGEWGHLPPRLRQDLLNGTRGLDVYPPEFAQLLREYFERLANDK